MVCPTDMKKEVDGLDAGPAMWLMRNLTHDRDLEFSILK